MSVSRKVRGRATAVGVALVILGSVAAGNASAAPVYVTGNECPTDSSMGGFTRQYSITQAVACIYDDGSSNIQGTTGEADLYLNAAAAQPTWGTGWTALGQNPLGFDFTADAGNDDGTFTIDTSVLEHGQFAVAIKDGGSPKWAIFLLPEDTFSGDWHFLTEGGSLSHFALFGRGTLDQDEDPSSVPEPASLLLFGSGLIVAAAKMRKRNAKAQLA
jgi:hypothetical protein